MTWFDKIPDSVDDDIDGDNVSNFIDRFPPARTNGWTAIMMAREITQILMMTTMVGLMWREATRNEPS